MSIFKTIIQIGSYIGNTDNDPLFDSIDSTVSCRTRSTFFLKEKLDNLGYEFDSIDNENVIFTS